MENKTFFSIILPIYNVEKYLDRCINSILNQSYQNFEIILVDDESPDSCPEKCDDWKNKNDKIKVIHKKNQGLGLARNTGLKIASGDYIIFIDSDDYITGNLLEPLNQEIEKNESDIIFFGYKRISNSGVTTLDFSLKPSKKVYDDNYEIKSVLLPEFINNKDSLFISAWNCSFRKEFLLSNKLEFKSEREYISEDIEFHLRAFNEVKKISFIEGSYYCYCQNDFSLTTSYKTDRFERLKRFYIYMEKKSKDLNYSSELLNSLRHSFISCVFGTLKMEAINYKKNGLLASYNNIKGICKDDFFLDSFKKLERKKENFSWRLIYILINFKMYYTIFVLSLLKYKKNGI